MKKLVVLGLSICALSAWAQRYVTEFNQATSAATNDLVVLNQTSSGRLSTIEVKKFVESITNLLPQTSGLNTQAVASLISPATNTLATSLVGTINLASNALATTVIQSTTNLVSNLTNWSQLATQYLGLPAAYFEQASPVPPLGWCSWGLSAYGPLTHESNFLWMVDRMVELKLNQYGWRWCQWDDGVFTSTNSSGIQVVDAVKWPHGMKYISDYCHAKGIKIGGYTELGAKTDGSFYGAKGNLQGNADLIATYDLDYLKFHGDFVASTAAKAYDDCAFFVKRVADGSSAPIHFYNISTYGELVYKPNYHSLYSAWYPSHGMSDNDGSFLNWAGKLDNAVRQRSFATKGHYLQTFDLIIGVWGVPLQLSIAAMTASPCFLVNPVYEPMHSYITNVYWLSIHQDPYVSCCAKIASLDTIVGAVTNNIFVRQLGGENSGKVAVMALNRTTSTNTMSFTLGAIGFPQTPANVFDVWSKNTLGVYSNNTITVSVPPTNCVLLKITSLERLEQSSVASILNPYNQFIITKTTNSEATIATTIAIGVTNSATTNAAFLGDVGQFSCLWLGPFVNGGYEEAALCNANHHTILGIGPNGDIHFRLNGSGGRWDPVRYAEINTNEFKIFCPVTITNLGSLVKGDLRLPTNTAPTSVTLGTTAPDEWMRITNYAGQVRYIPTWVNH